ncbi:hypothetical protein [Streptomyces griseosporeus]|uniref:hypothetical protein n=1 Tax=Streptomyces griseosporeus TaxID=1910 RepID=UPI00370084E1
MEDSRVGGRAPSLLGNRIVVERIMKMNRMLVVGALALAAVAIPSAAQAAEPAPLASPVVNPLGLLPGLYPKLEQFNQDAPPKVSALATALGIKA